MNRTDFELEICSNSIQSTIAADQGGANRVELCDNLYEGGTTPSIGTLIACKERTSIDVFPIIRPRGGDFLYSKNEVAVMRNDIELFRQYGADGVVIGCLTADGKVDYENCARLMESAKDLPVTFHRAFDMTENPFQSLEVLKKLGVSRLLTSGQANLAIDGLELLTELVQLAGSDLKIMIGSGIAENNILQIAKVTQAKVFHASFRTAEDSQMIFRKTDIFMGGLPEIPEYEHKFSDAKRIREAIHQLQQL